MNVRIFPPEEMVCGRVELPLSKSFINRLMVIDALAGKATPAYDPSLCGTDIQVLAKALTQPRVGATCNIDDAGTAMRFLTSFFAATPGCDAVVDGSERMRQRPIGPLVEALRSLGADITYTAAEGHAPLHIKGRRLKGGRVAVDASVSSQFVSALMLVAPYTEEGLTIQLEGDVKSAPYILLTAHIMKLRGADVAAEGREVRVEPRPYNTLDIRPERDWSAAAFWAQLTAITAGFITMGGLDRESMQPDRRMLGIFSHLGVAESDGDDDDDDDDQRQEGDIELCGSPELSPRFIHDFSDTPDLAQPALVACCMVGIPFRFTGLQTLRGKETDRIEALRSEMLKLGVMLTSDNEGELAWEGERRPITELPVFDSHGDHRMAMSLAPVAAFMPGIVVNHAECVAKSYPGYWEQLASLGFTLADADAADIEVVQ